MGNLNFTSITTKLFVVLFIMFGMMINQASASCSASFTWTQTANNTITFTNTSMGTFTNPTYYWAFGDATNSNLQSPVHVFNIPGAYVVCMHITDSIAGCTSHICDTIHVTGVVICTLTATCGQYHAASCNTCTDGSAYVSATGGTSPYTYVWNTSPVQTTQVATGLLPGTYSVIITDANNCTATCVATVSYTACNLAAYTYQLTNASCSTCADGVGRCYASGGTTPYSYSWSTSPVQTTANATGLVPGLYTCCVTDAHNCVSCSTVHITDSVNCNNFAVSCSQFYPASCNTCPDGFGLITASGGTSPYSYTWSTSPVQLTSTASGLLPGTYSVCATDAHGCVACCSVTITDSFFCNLSVGCYQYHIASCSTCADGIGHASTSGGATPYNYSWSTSPVQTTYAATGLLPGSYSVCVTDANNCTACCVVTITDSSNVNCNMYMGCYQYQNASCSTCADGVGHAYASGGASPYTYSWSTTPVQTTQVATGLLPGTYTVCATDAHNCTACCVVTITDTYNCNTLAVSCYQYHQASCNTCHDGAAHAYASGGTAPYTYSWNTSPVQTTAFATGLAAGSYVVLVTDAHGCTNSCTVNITYTTNSCQAYFYFYPDTSAPHTYWAINYSTSNHPPISYLWTWGDNTSSTGPYPSHTYSTPGTYTICLTITDSAGCTSTYCRTDSVMRTSSSIIYVNVISPTTGITESQVLNNWSVYPNPVNSSMMINYSLVQATNVNIDIYDILGNKVSEVLNTHQPQGNYSINWDARNTPQGIYLLQIKVNDKVISSKIAVMK